MGKHTGRYPYEKRKHKNSGARPSPRVGGVPADVARGHARLHPGGDAQSARADHHHEPPPRTGEQRAGLLVACGGRAHVGATREPQGVEVAERVRGGAEQRGDVGRVEALSGGKRRGVDKWW